MRKKEYRKHVLNERRLRQAMEDKVKCAKIRKGLIGRTILFSSKTPSAARDMFVTRVFMKPRAGISRMTGDLSGRDGCAAAAALWSRRVMSSRPHVH